MRAVVRLAAAVLLSAWAVLSFPASSSADNWCNLCARQDNCINLPHDPYCCVNCCMCEGNSLVYCQDYCAL